MVDLDYLHQSFVLMNYQWRIDGKLRRPTKDELEDTLDKLVEKLYGEPNLSQAELGHLIVQKEDDRYNVYLHLGDIQ